MSILQWLGLILFVVLLYQCARGVPQKWRRLQEKQSGALADLGFSAIACGFCLWAIVSIFSFPS